MIKPRFFEIYHRRNNTISSGFSLHQESELFDHFEARKLK